MDLRKRRNNGSRSSKQDRKRDVDREQDTDRGTPRKMLSKGIRSAIWWMRERTTMEPTCTRTRTRTFAAVVAPVLLVARMGSIAVVVVVQMMKRRRKEQGEGDCVGVGRS